MAKSILDAPVSYMNPIGGEGKFVPGNMVRIQGHTSGTTCRFNVNLLCGSENYLSSDVALRISVYISEGCTELNSSKNGAWGKEQHESTLPIKNSEKFEMILLCNSHHYKVFINGHPYCEYPHRIRYDRVTHLGIDGDVSLTSISYASGISIHPLVLPVKSKSEDLHIIIPSELETAPIQIRIPLPPHPAVKLNNNIFCFNGVTCSNKDAVMSGVISNNKNAPLRLNTETTAINQISSSFPRTPSEEHSYSPDTIAGVTTAAACSSMVPAANGRLYDESPVILNEDTTPPTSFIRRFCHVKEKQKLWLAIIIVTMLIVLIIYASLFPKKKPSLTMRL